MKSILVELSIALADNIVDVSGQLLDMLRLILRYLIRLLLSYIR